MRRRAGEVLVIGEERLGAEPLLCDDEATPEATRPGSAEREAGAEAPTPLAERFWPVAAGRLRLHTVVVGGVLVAIVGAWLVVGLGGAASSSSEGLAPAGGLPMVSERADPPPSRDDTRRRAVQNRTRPRPRGEAPGAGEPDADLPGPTPGASASPTASAAVSAPVVSTPTEEAGPGAPTRASAATVHREFGP